MNTPRPADRMPARVLVVEDDASIGRGLVDALEANGFVVDWCRDGATATHAFETRRPDLVLLDAGLPDMDGFSLCRWLRLQDHELPIIMVTARDAEIDIVVGLDAGATDYVTKPFSTNVLMARIRAHLRGKDTVDPQAPLSLGSVVVDPGAYTVTADGERVELRPREFELLVHLARQAGRVVTREELLSEVWDVHWSTSTKTLDMHVVALRRKLGANIEIANVRGVGYRLDVP